MSRKRHMPLVKVVAERIRHARAMSGLLQVDVATSLGITQPAVCKLERGASSPSLQTLNDMADLFETSTDYLLGRTEVFG